MSHYKRENSVSVNDLQILSDNIKRFAISIDGKAYNRVSPPTDHRGSKLSLKMPSENPHIVPVMSTAKDNFKDNYELLQEIGRGGFSKVYKCKNRINESICAVKIVDLRPLRLRERFNPARIRREVDIMRRLSHPNIIQFLDVYETPDQLLMIMEYFPGDELFDVIIAKKFFTEKDAKPIFAQICRALHYLHCLNIIHRDIKPENVLISRTIDPSTGYPIAKLVDFGLSKNAGTGSAAKTFVGTPCYLAPEVEYTSKGLGGTYGLPADCWSLGAVLYVMLVARFPEFETDMYGKLVLRLPPALWDNVSTSAKELIRSLMNANPAARNTVYNVLQHPWLEMYRMSAEQLHKIALENYTLSQGLQEEEEMIEKDEQRYFYEQEQLERQQQQQQQQQQRQQYNQSQNNNSGSGSNNKVTDIRVDTTPANINSAIVIRMPQLHDNTMNGSSSSSTPGNGTNNNSANGSASTGANTEQFPLHSLLHLQRKVADCFQDALTCFIDAPEIAIQIRQAASLCRQQVSSSLNMLRQVEQTAVAVLQMFQDLELAVEENEPQLAMNFFNLVRNWVSELKDTVRNTQNVHKLAMDEIQKLIENATMLLQKQDRVVSYINQPLIMMINETLLDIITRRKQRQQNHHHQQQQQQQIQYSTVNETNDTNRNTDNSMATDASVLSDSQELIISPTQSPLNNNNSTMNTTTTTTTYISSPNSNNPSSTGSAAGASTMPPGEMTLTPEDVLELFVILFGQPTAATSSPYPTQSSSSSTTTYTNNGNITSPYTTSVSNNILPYILNRNKVPLQIENNVTVAEPISTHTSTATTYNGITEMNMNNSNMEIHDATTSTDGVNDTTSITTTTTTTAMQQYDPTPSPPSSTPIEHIPLPLPAAVTETESEQQMVLNDRVNRMAKATLKLNEALENLNQIDFILMRISVFWGNTEVVLDVLTKKGQHMEQLIGFASKPKLMGRFKERMEEYKRFWESVSMMCNNYINGVDQTQYTNNSSGSGSGSGNNNSSSSSGGGMSNNSSGSSSSNANMHTSTSYYSNNSGNSNNSNNNYNQSNTRNYTTQAYTNNSESSNNSYNTTSAYSSYTQQSLNNTYTSQANTYTTMEFQGMMQMPSNQSNDSSFENNNDIRMQGSYTTPTPHTTTTTTTIPHNYNHTPPLNTSGNQYSGNTVLQQQQVYSSRTQPMMYPQTQQPMAYPQSQQYPSASYPSPSTQASYVPSSSQNYTTQGYTTTNITYVQPQPMNVNPINATGSTKNTIKVKKSTDGMYGFLDTNTYITDQPYSTTTTSNNTYIGYSNNNQPSPTNAQHNSGYTFNSHVHMPQSNTNNNPHNILNNANYNSRNTGSTPMNVSSGIANRQQLNQTPPPNSYITPPNSNYHTPIVTTFNTHSQQHMRTQPSVDSTQSDQSQVSQQSRHSDSPNESVGYNKVPGVYPRKSSSDFTTFIVNNNMIHEGTGTSSNSSGGKVHAHTPMSQSPHHTTTYMNNMSSYTSTTNPTTTSSASASHSSGSNTGQYISYNSMPVPVVPPSTPTHYTSYATPPQQSTPVMSTSPYPTTTLHSHIPPPIQFPPNMNPPVTIFNNMTLSDNTTTATTASNSNTNKTNTNNTNNTMYTQQIHYGHPSH